MAVTQAIKKPTFERVWAMMEKNALEMDKFRESQAETARQMAESRAEYDRQRAETDRLIKDINKRFGEHVNRFGEVVEYMVAPKLCEKFQELGFEFEEESQRKKVRNKKLNISFEIDIFLENGDKAMLVEVKTNLEIEDINYHLKRMEKMRACANYRGDKRTFLGAVAGVVISEDTKKYALDQGFYVIEPSGESFNITLPNGKPKEW